MGFKGEALNLSCLLSGELRSPLKFLSVVTLVFEGGQSPPSEVKNVKGFALKTHQRLRLWKLRAFKKARAKLLIVFGKSVS